MNTPIFTRELEIQPYLETYQAMHEFIQNRKSNTYDEIWFVEHPSTFTQGKAGKPEHLLHSTTIPVIQTDRGGQITYHGLGQQIMYVLLDLKRLKIKVRDVVTCLENAVINTLDYYQINAYAKPDAPGVYIDQKKICSLGLHIKNGCTLHGLALNIDMDLSPFDLINPCGYQGLKMTQLKDYTNNIAREEINQSLVDHFIWLLTHIPNRQA